MQETLVSQAPSLDVVGRRAIRWLWVAALPYLAFRYWYASWRCLVPDEAYYWVWSRHLAPGYFDHAPGVAWTIKSSTLIFGDTELGVRFWGVTLLALMVVLLARFALREAGVYAAAWTAFLLLCLPATAGFSNIMTPDTPALFFQTCAMLCAAEVFCRPDDSRAQRWAWLGFGAFTGLAMVSKYTSVLLPFAVFMAVATSPEARHHFRRPWFYLAALLAFIGVTPVIYWNATHDWISIRYQLHHGTDPDDRHGPLINFAAYVGSQAGIYTPVLFAIGMLVLWRGWRQYRAVPMPWKILLWNATVPFAFFGLTSFRTMAQGNWPGFAYFPLTVLIACWVAANPFPRRRRWAWAGAAVALVINLWFHFPELGWACGIKIRNKTDQMFGWRECGRILDKLGKDRLVVANRLYYAGEATFYMKGQPDVWALNYDSRSNAYDYFEGKPDLTRHDSVLLVGGGTDRLGFDYSRRDVRRITLYEGHRQLREFKVTLLDR
ncbi:MAG: glycosyltransferase family 39 protein [Candidatus Sumerlaeaceae bacterium]|nr:glycosyltransferase family 39 protein [Candidatus Sumerlaeaceae bacterium]